MHASYTNPASVELSVIVPVFNEEVTVERFLDALRRTLVGLALPFEIVMIDDGSRDETWLALSRLKPLYPELRAYRFSRNFGKDAALCAGVAMAVGRLCVIMDGDFEHPLELLPRMLEAYRYSDANIVDAVKTRARGETAGSRFFAQGFYRLFYAVSGYDLEGHTDYKLFDGQVREAWLSFSERDIFFRGMMAWLGFRRGQVHFTVPDVPGRQSRWSRPKLLGLALKSFTSFSSVPLQGVTALGAMNLIFALLLGLQTFYTWWTGGAVEGFTTVILLQLIQGSVTMIALGVMGLYLAGILREVKARPRYLISDRLESC